MKRTHSSRAKWRRLSLCVPLTLLVLTGCQGDKIVARVNNEPITEKELFTRALALRPNDVPPELEIGAAALVSIIRERLTRQLAREKDVMPDEKAVLTYVAYKKRIDPNLSVLMDAGRLNQEELINSTRYEMMNFNIGTDGARTDEKVLQEEYEKLRKPQPGRPGPLKLPEMWTIKTMPVPDATVGKTILEELKKTGNFQAAAQKLQLPERAIQEQKVAIDNFGMNYPQAKAALQNVEPGKFADTPITLKITDPQTGMGRDITMLIQVIRKDPEYTFSLDEVRTPLQQMILQQKNPQWLQRKDSLMAEFTKKTLDAKGVQIYIPRYEYLINSYIKPMAEANLATPGMARPGGAPPPSGGAGAPPTVRGGAPPTVGGGAPGKTP